MSLYSQENSLCWKLFLIEHFEHVLEAYLETCQTAIMERFAKIDNS